MNPSSNDIADMFRTDRDPESVAPKFKPVVLTEAEFEKHIKRALRRIAKDTGAKVSEVRKDFKTSAKSEDEAVRQWNEELQRRLIEAGLSK